MIRAVNFRRQESSNSITPISETPRAMSNIQIVIIGGATQLFMFDAHIGLPQLAPNCDVDHRPDGFCIK